MYTKMLRTLSGIATRIPPDQLFLDSSDCCLADIVGWEGKSLPDIKVEMKDGISDVSEHGDEIWKSIRKLSGNKVAMLAVQTLLDNGQMSFGELRKATCVDSNDLNHALIGLKDLGMIDQHAKKYCLTAYCVALLLTIRRLKVALVQLKCLQETEDEKATGGIV
jgi:DNA-binding HxlR family transcriptional regulator